MTKFWCVTRKRDGKRTHIEAEDWTDQYTKRSFRAEPIDRLPRDHEQWIDGRWVIDTEAAADHDYVAKRGQLAIHMMHVRKGMEAALIVAGVRFDDGILKREAEATGQSIDDLVAKVLANASIDEADEIARIMAKRAARGQ